MKYPKSFRHQNFAHFDSRQHNELRQAIRNRDKEYVQHLLQKGAQANGICEAGYTNFAYTTPLHLAVVSRCPEIVRMLLDKGANVRARNWQGETSLIMAAKMQNMEIVDLLLASNVDDSEDDHGLAHLHIACMRNNVDIVRKLLLMNHGKNLNKSVGEKSLYWAGCTPLHFAVHFESFEVLKFLLGCGADITARDARHLTPLHLADLQRNEKVIDVILAAHKLEFRNPMCSNGLTHFHIACTRNDISIVEHFLNIGIDVNLEVGSSYWKGWRPIHFAIYYECPDVIELLLKNHAHLETESLPRLLASAFILNNISMQCLSQTSRRICFKKCKEMEQLTSLYLACIQDNDEELLRFLLSSDCDPAAISLDAPIWAGCTPLHLAARYESQNVVKLLLNHVTDIMLQDAGDRTPLHIAFEKKFSKISELIVEKCVCPLQNLIDKQGLSIFHILCTMDRLDLIEALLKSGVDVNAQVGSDSACWSGFTPLHFACQFERPKVVDLLLKYDADISITNELNLNPFDNIIHQLCSFEYTYWRRTCCEILMKILTYVRVKIKDFNNWGITMLHATSAIRSVDKQMLEKYLIENEIDIDRRIQYPGSLVYNGCTPLHLALQFSNMEQALLLLQNEANPCVLNDVGDTPLEYAFNLGLKPFQPSSTDDYHKIRSFLSVKTPIENFKLSHFHIACALGLVDFVKHVLENTSDEKLRKNFVNCRDDAGRTPLHSLILQQNIETVKVQITTLLLQNGADVDAQDCELQTPLHLMWDRYNDSDRRGLLFRQDRESDLGLMRIFLNHEANVDLQNVFGETLLHKIYSSYRGLIQPRSQDDEEGWVNMTVTDTFNFCKQKLILVLENGADINKVDELGQTCLSMMAHDRKQSRAARSLVNCITTMQRHIKKLEAIGFIINEINQKAYQELSFYNEAFDEDAFTDVCKRELELMKSTRLDPFTTLHEILFKSDHEMQFYHRNAVLLEMATSQGRNGKFPIYGYLLKIKMKSGQVRQSLVENSNEALSSLIRDILPTECLYEIVKHLSNVDLKNIILAEKLLDDNLDLQRIHRT